MWLNLRNSLGPLFLILMCPPFVMCMWYTNTAWVFGCFVGADDSAGVYADTLSDLATLFLGLDDRMDDYFMLCYF